MADGALALGDVKLFSGRRDGQCSADVTCPVKKSWHGAGRLPLHHRQQLQSRSQPLPPKAKPGCEPHGHGNFRCAGGAPGPRLPRPQPVLETRQRPLCHLSSAGFPSVIHRLHSAAAPQFRPCSWPSAIAKKLSVPWGGALERRASHLTAARPVGRWVPREAISLCCD
jgi:hypothetical protein